MVESKRWLPLFGAVVLVVLGRVVGLLTVGDVGVLVKLLGSFSLFGDVGEVGVEAKLRLAFDL